MEEHRGGNTKDQIGSSGMAWGQSRPASDGKSCQPSREPPLCPETDVTQLGVREDIPSSHCSKPGCGPLPVGPRHISTPPKGSSAGRTSPLPWDTQGVREKGSLGPCPPPWGRGLESRGYLLLPDKELGPWRPPNPSRNKVLQSAGVPETVAHSHSPWVAQASPSWGSALGPLFP